MEHRIVMIRQELRGGALGECGAAAIYDELRARGISDAPSIRTIGRVLERTGQISDVRRVRRPSPPRGWHLPGLATGDAELDSFDFVEDLKIRNGPLIDVLNGISLHGHLVASWPTVTKTAIFTAACLQEHWRQFGLPTYAQFDNDSVFVGNHRFPDALGRVARLCLHLGVIPVFAPPREHGFQNLVESKNSRWTKSVWHRYEHTDLPDLIRRSDAYVAEHRRRHAVASERFQRAPILSDWSFDLNAALRGRVILIRRADDHGKVVILKRTHVVDTGWAHRLIRVEMDLDADALNCFGLRRSAPTEQPLLNSIPYRFPRKPFNE